MGLSGHLHVSAAIRTLHDFVREAVEGRHNFWVRVFSAHEPLDGEEGILRVGDSLPLGDLAHVALAGLGVDGHH